MIGKVESVSKTFQEVTDLKSGGFCTLLDLKL